MNTKASTLLQHPAGRVVSKIKLSDSNNDLAYWLAQSAVARLAAAEHLRQQYSILVNMELKHNFRNFINLLNTYQIEYMVAGGFAVALYGYPRYTGDIDIWINPTPQNATVLIGALQEFGYNGEQVTFEDLTTPDVVTQLGYPPNRIDIATGLAGVKFAECWKNKVSIPYEDVVANFISLEDLKKNKKATARQQDLLDLQNLPD
ncbi:hypothetical protein [Pontibacter sp. HJ8]